MVNLAGMEASAGSNTGELGVYLHVPFCRGKCDYCAFPSRPIAGRDELDRYLEALAAEIDAARALLSRARLHSVYFGGGTPSLVPPSEIASLLGSLRQAAAEFPGEAEVTLEANPESVGLKSLEALRRAGVNRLSLGVQSFEDGALRSLGRPHDAASAERAIVAARRAGFHNLSLDLIVALEDPWTDSFEDDLGRAVALAPEHLSVYLLSVDAPSVLARATAAGTRALPCDERRSDIFERCSAVLRAAGYEHYEVSSFARPGWRAVHNCGYWEGRAYLGLGAAAHSFLPEPGGVVRRFNIADPDEYVARVGQALSPVESAEHLSPAVHLRERLMLTLRTSDGVVPADYGEAAEALATKLERGVARGLFVRSRESGRARYRPTAKGFLLADGIALDLWDLIPDSPSNRAP